MKLFIIFLGILHSISAQADHFRVVKEDCTILVKDIETDNGSVRAIKVDMQGAVALLPIPLEFWPPEEGKVYRWRDSHCHHCKMWMRYEDGQLNIRRNRQVYTHESESLTMITDLDFLNVERVQLKEGLRWIPFLKRVCER